MRIRHETYAAIFDAVYLGLVTNLLLVVGCLPLVVGLVVTDPARSWPLLALVAPLCAPGLVGVFAVLASFGELASRSRSDVSGGRSTDHLRTFGRAWRASVRPATAVGALAVGALIVLGVDAKGAWERPIGAVALPVLVVLMVLVVSTTLHALVVLAERPTARLRLVLRACVYLAVRRWYLTAASLAVIALLGALVASRPAIGFGLAAAPLLYVVWANSRYALRAALDSPEAVAHQA
jgi:uncharacterized membrane protein YesL